MMAMVSFATLAAACTPPARVAEAPKSPVSTVRQTSSDEDAAQAAEGWLRLNDAWRIAESWAMLSPKVKSVVPNAAAFEELLRSARPKGNVRERTRAYVKRFNAPPDKPPGEYVRVAFETIFSEDGTAMETVVMARVAGGPWEVAGSLIARANPVDG